jgi:hypothetical protein
MYLGVAGARLVTMTKRCLKRRECSVVVRKKQVVTTKANTRSDMTKGYNAIFQKIWLTEIWALGYKPPQYETTTVRSTAMCQLIKWSVGAKAYRNQGTRTDFNPSLKAHRKPNEPI